MVVGMSLALVQSKVAASNKTHIAKEMGLSRSYVSRVLNGRKEPSFPVAARLAEELGITLDELYRCWTSVRKAA